MTKLLMTEDELKALIADPASRRKGFALIVELYSTRLYWHLRRMVYNHDDANDLLQNTFIKAWEALDNFRGEAKISTWLYRIAMYEGLSFLRQRKREQEHFISGEDEAQASYLMERLESDSYFDGDDYERRFQKALLKLPEKQALTFRLRYYDELPYEQISELTGTSVGALKASYHHAVQKIKTCLSSED